MSRGRDFGDMEDGGDTPRKKARVENPLSNYWTPYIVEKVDVRLIGAWNMTDPEMAALLERVLIPDGGRMPILVYNGRVNLENLADARPMSIRQIVGATGTWHELCEFVARSVFVVHDDTPNAFFDMLMPLISRVYASVTNGNRYILTPSTRDRVRYVVTSVVQDATVSFGGAHLATVRRAANPLSDPFYIAHNATIFTSAFFLYGRIQEKIANPFSEQGRAEIEAERAASRQPGYVRPLYVGNALPVGPAFRAQYANAPPAVLDARAAELRRTSRLWRMFCEHVYGIMRPHDAMRDVCSEDEFDAKVRESESNANQLIDLFLWQYQTQEATRICPVFVSGSEQNGKGTLAAVMQAIFGALMKTESVANLMAPFHGQLLGLTALFVDEAGDMFATPAAFDFVKRITGSKELTFNVKGKTPVTASMLISIMCAMNDVSIPSDVSHKTGRLWPIFVTGRMTDPEWYNELYALLDDAAAVEELVLIFSRTRREELAGTRPGAETPHGIFEDRKMWVGTHMAMYAHRVYDTIVKMTTPSILLNALVHTTINGMPQKYAQQCTLTGNMTGDTKKIIVHLARLGLIRVAGDPNNPTIVPLTVRSKTRKDGREIDSFFE